MMPYAVEELVAVQWNAAGVKEQIADADESKEQRKLQRVDGMVRNLRGDKIKAQHGSDRKAKQGSRTKERIDANNKAGDERPGQLARAASNA